MQLDTDSNVNESSKVIYLNYSKAEDILKILNDISGSFSQEQNADFKTVITSHEETNSIIIRSNPQTIKTLVSIVEQLDIRRPQVYVEAIIVEISESTAQALGVMIGKKKAGSYGDIGIFSFHSHKNISTLGEGGMLVTNNENFAKILPIL